jgi:tetratricopeptide (TPR) repeat protein
VINRFLIAMAGMVFLMTGCRSTASVEPVVDRTIARYAKAGGEAYAEGFVPVATEKYRMAIRRAWAIDDPLESGTIAYNLAACMTSLDRTLLARDWLLEARAELKRAGASTGNAWLLESKVAIDQDLFEDAVCSIDRAACSVPPCGNAEPACGNCGLQIPCLGKKRRQKREREECKSAFQVQIQLARARVAAEQYDSANARAHFGSACELAMEIESFDLQAELHDVAALIHIADGEYLSAGCHLDREAENLRLAGNYREIPNTLQLAAAAYGEVERFDLAADRMLRVARIFYGRGDTRASWEHLQTATSLANLAGAENTKIRLALLANEIAMTIAEDEPPLQRLDDAYEAVQAPEDQDSFELLPPLSR